MGKVEDHTRIVMRVKSQELAAIARKHGTGSEHAWTITIAVKSELKPTYRPSLKKIIDSQREALWAKHKDRDVKCTTQVVSQLPGMVPLQLFVPAGVWLPDRRVIYLMRLLGVLLAPLGVGPLYLIYLKCRGAPLQALLVNGPLGGTPRAVVMTAHKTIHAPAQTVEVSGGGGRKDPRDGDGQVLQAM